MKIHSTPIAGLCLLEPSPFEDHRGSFCRLYSREILESVGIEKPIAQINLSKTTAPFALRGMHFQNSPYRECKLVQCLRGKIFDVAVDLRRDSETFLQWHAEILEESVPRCFVIPEGFAHGFMTLTPETEVLYFSTEFYHPESEQGLLYNDPLIGIQWPHEPSELSARDQFHPLLTKQVIETL